MKVFKNIIKIILGSILIICLLGTIFIYEVKGTVLNKEFIINKLEENNYYENLYTNILSSMKGYIEPSGLDEKILDNIISREEIKDDVNTIIGNVYDDKDEKIDTETIKETLNNNINNYLNEENLKVNDKSQLEEFENKIIEEYESQITYSQYMKYLKIVANDKLIAILNIVNKLCILGIILSIIGILLINLKKNEKNVINLMTFMLSCGIIIKAFTIFTTRKINIDNITILNGAVSITLRDIIKTILNDISKIGVIMIIVSLVLIILNNVIFSKKEKDV